MSGKEEQQQNQSAPRGVFIQPMESLIVLLPVIIFYEWNATSSSDSVIAFKLLQDFIALFGDAGRFAPAFAVIGILIFTHVVSRKSWKVKLSSVLLMYAESFIYTVPLILIPKIIPPVKQLFAAVEKSDTINELALGIGAGIYEELVFRLILLSAIVVIGKDMLKFNRQSVAVVAVMLSALVFSAIHYEPVGAEKFEVVSFVFRALAGAYLAGIFWFRGYGVAAGCHAAYNSLIITMF